MFKLPLTALLIALIVAPIPAFSATDASQKPSCTLSVASLEKKLGTFKGDALTVLRGTTIKLTWKSENATTGIDTRGFSVRPNGTATTTVETTSKYTYKFLNGSKEAVCEVHVTVVSAEINRTALRSSVSKPSLSGTATGTKSVRVVVKSGKKILFTKKNISVRKGQWSVKVNKALKNGKYEVSVFGDKAVGNNELATGTLTIAPKSDSAVSVSSIPLLFGGTARASTSVPIAYLRVQNTSNETAHVRGFTIIQKGSAPTVTVSAFTTSDNKGGSRSVLSSAPGKSLFSKDKTVFVPLVADIPSKQFLIFTIKASLGPSSYLSIGKQLMIDVVSIDTDAKSSGSFPVRGTTWTIGY